MTLIRRSFGSVKKISLFTLGTMRAVGSNKEMYNVLKKACLIGINHIETSPAYGKAELLIGNSLQKLKKEELQPANGWIITSKILPGKSFTEGKKQIRQTLSKLGLPRIQNLAIHGLNLPKHLEWFIHGDGCKLISWAKENDLIDQVGFSSHGSTSLINDAIKSGLFKFCSLHLHLLDPEKLPLAKIALQKGMGVMAISPADKGGQLYAPSQKLIDICYPIPPLELAYRFLLSQGISTLTLGAHKPQDLSFAQKLVNSCEPLNKAEEASISRLKKELKGQLGETMCGQCRQCLPCPNNVPIPEILRLRNLAFGYDLTTFAKQRYNLIGRAGHWWESENASACRKCGDCLPRCPNNLKIPELLQEAHLNLFDNPTKRLWD